MPAEPRDPPKEDDLEPDEAEDRGGEPRSKQEVTPLDEDQNVEDGIEVNET